jgi:hypothetical protein
VHWTAITGLIAREAPLPTNFRRDESNVNTTSLLYGLPAIVGAIAKMHRIFDVRAAETKAVKTIGPSATHTTSPLQP